ncbi:uncharacterized protein LOC117226715 isoform X1 [Megalopta genalis]|uniref:uncharacterized protein LOC117226715 isoform X1 n=2 Tax=Megalopta genalis TaxID=115081 RepID=UPI003FD2029B
MPGIYVRETSWIDWMQQSENPVLTVPGSYWLCHKHNIYKFIFKYHRTIRTIKHFTYGKELMKIIRRIIKNPPRQGQQFSTNNLLVTYNHTSWTRHDKIFAMTKFKERSAAACSHAFVLTIKVMSLLESSEQAIKYAVTTCSDKPLVWNTKELVPSFHNDLPEHSKQCNIIQEKVFESKNVKQIDDNFTLNKMTKNSTNKELVKQRTHNKDFNKPQPSITLSELSENVGINNKQKLNTYLNDSNEKSEKRNNCTISNKHSTVANVEEDRLMSNRLQDSNILKEETIENKDYSNKVDEDIIKNIISESDNSEVNSTNVDSASLPYQYLIEREIEDAKLNTINLKSPILGSKKRKRHEVDEKSSVASDDLLIVVPETDEPVSSTKRKRGSDNVTSKSSDITDLVMEGLMFTIRQAQGTVVIEQKTKSELGEVLENSEKIETRKQEKCLRNSSLLGLENLITMIESPKKPETQQNPQTITMQENTSKYQNTNKYTFNNVNYSFKDICFTNARLNRNSHKMNKNQYTEMYETNIKLTDNEDLQYGKENKEKEEWEEEEDIIPETLQNLSPQTSVLSFERVNKSIQDMTDKDLLMDDIGTEISAKLGVAIERDSHFAKKLKLQHEGVINNIKKANIPIIISNEIIATDQIPLPLQKILHNKSSTNTTSINSTNETEKRNFSYNIHAERLSLYYNILEGSESLESSQTLTSSEIERSNINAPLLTLEGEHTNIDLTKNKLKESKDKHSTSINKVEQISSRELQDVTQEFYQNILYLEKKKNLNDQHLTKKSVNMIQDPHTNAHIEMIKFFHDITKGAKVVITRMSTKNIHNIIAKNS